MGYMEIEYIRMVVKPGKSKLTMAEGVERKVLNKNRDHKQMTVRSPYQKND
jgi:hypothetical protein